MKKKNNNTENFRRLGLNIAYYRKLHHLSQMQLAEAVGISRTHMSRIENYDSSVSLDVVFNIADALDEPVHKFFEYR